MGVVGHQRHGHVMGMVSHRFWVMSWVWVCVVVFVGLAVVGHRFHGFVGHAVGFVWWVIGVVVMPWVWWVIGFGSCHESVGCRGFYFCGCGPIFLGSCGLILVVVVVGCVKWWLTNSCDCYLL